MALDPLEILLRVASMQRKHFPHGPVNTKGAPTVDGAMRPIVWGGGYPQHPLLRLYKDRARRTVA